MNEEDSPVAGSTTLVVEPHSQGHRLYYSRLLIDKCQARGDHVAILTTQTAVESAEWRVHIGDRTPTIVLNQLNKFALSDIATVSDNLGASLTIVPDADGYLLSAFRGDWTGAGNLNMLVMRSDVQPGPPLSWSRPAKTLVKRSLILGSGMRSRIRVFVLRSPLVRRRRPLHWVPDPVTLECTSQEIVAMRKRLDSDLYWFGVFGAITPRKHLPLVIEAMLDQPGTGLLIAGFVDPAVADAIAPLIAIFVSNGGQVIQLSGTITDAEFDSAIGAVDCVIAAHSNEGPSGVVAKAAASGRRLILAGAQSLRRDAAYLGEQATWSPLRIEDLRRAVQHARRLPAPAEPVELGAGHFLETLTWR